MIRTPIERIRWAPRKRALALGACALGSLALALGSAAADPGPQRPSLDRELTHVADRVNRGVVLVRSLRHVSPGGGAAVARGRCQGTGVILSSGHIATTLSVAGPGDEITVRYHDGRTSAARVAGVSPIRELVLLEPEFGGGEGLAYGSADSLHAGSWVFLVGFAMSAPEPSLSSGRFSSRTILNLNDSSPDTIELLQLEANVFPGSSGAAVVNSRGRFVGIILGALGSDGFLDPVVLSSFKDDLPLTHCILTAEPPLGISFALPSGDVKELARAADRGTIAQPGYLGVRVEMASETGAGVRVLEVVSGSPAATAGVRPGDVIHRMNDQAVDDPMSLVSIIRELAPGTSARLAVAPRDGGQPRQAEVVLGDYTHDYRTPLVWQRLLAGRSTSLGDARERLIRQMELLDSELRAIRSLSATSSPMN